MRTSNIEKIKGFTALGQKEDTRQRIDRHILAISPDAYMLGSFDRSRNLLAYAAAYNPQRDGSADFFEDHLAQESLLQVQKQKLSLFIAPEKSLLVPRSLHKPDHSKDWFHELLFLDQEQVIAEWTSGSSRFQLLYSYPLTTQDLLERLFPGRLIHPLTAPLFRSRSVHGGHIEVLYTGHRLYMSQWEDHRLLGHYIKEADNPEELAFHLHQSLHFQGQIPALIRGFANPFPPVHPYNLAEVTTYFPAETVWEGAFLESSQKKEDALIAYMEELILCV